MAAFLVMVFVVAWGALIAGTPLCYAWFAQQPMKLGSITLELGLAPRGGTWIKAHLPLQALVSA